MAANSRASTPNTNIVGAWSCQAQARNEKSIQMSINADGKVETDYVFNQNSGKPPRILIGSADNEQISLADWWYSENHSGRGDSSLITITHATIGMGKLKPDGTLWFKLDRVETSGKVHEVVRSSQYTCTR
jgi:hypothetical protein